MQISRLTFKATSIALLTACALAGCASKGPPIRADYDRGVDFSALHTFGFPAQTGTDRGGYATLITSHFKEAIKREMTVRGYTFTATDPDMLINFYSEARDKTKVYSHPTPLMGMGYGYGGYGYGGYGYPRYGWYSAWPFYGDVDVVSYTAGTLKIDVVDPKREQTIWEASVEEQLTDKAQDNPQPTISRLVTSMFAKFPYGASAAAAKNAKN
jgi:hypothetical protein